MLKRHGLLGGGARVRTLFLHLERGGSVLRPVNAMGITRLFVDQSSRQQAKSAFVDEEAAGAKPSILSTGDFDEAQAFAEGVYWLAD